jgi:hypothetical protein
MYRASKRIGIATIIFLNETCSKRALYHADYSQLRILAYRPLSYRYVFKQNSQFNAVFMSYKSTLHYINNLFIGSS